MFLREKGNRMNREINFIISVILLLLGLLAMMFAFRQQLKNEAKVLNKRRVEHLKIPYLIEEIKELLYQLTTTQLDSFIGSKELYERELNKRVSLKKALRGCTNGSDEDKQYIIDVIADLLRNYLIQQHEIDQVIYFNKPKFMSAKDMFDIIVYRYTKEYGKNALTKLIEEEGFDQGVKVEEETVPVYRITEGMIKEAFFKRQIQLTYEDKINIVAQRIYELYKGFGSIDIVRDMAIDGVSGGVSGVVNLDITSSIEEFQSYNFKPHNYDSIWIFFKGKSIHLEFLSFGSEKELKRVCQNIYRYNKAGQLSENIGYKVNEMRDGSRVVVVRPPFSESWAFFVRKFHLKNIELEELFHEESAIEMIGFLKFLMKGGRITSVTGSQGSGKTTLLMALIRHIYPTLTLRVQETAFELHLRKLYPKRNILTFKETETVTGQMGLDLQKKTDGSVNILGEIATDEVSVLMLQMAQVASLFTVFTHHAKTVKDLVLNLRNSLLKCNVFRDEKVATEQVVSVLDFDIHLNKDYEGNRYIERISEIVAIESQSDYSYQYREKEDKIAAFMDTVVEYFQKRTDTICYEERIIYRYNQGEYEWVQKITEEQKNKMKQRMTVEDSLLFDVFMEKYWEENIGVVTNWST